MISREKLTDIRKNTSLHLYQQEKDYLIKLFLYNYFKRYDDAVFKGGTCLRYIYGTDRFSEDIDLNLQVKPKEFRKEVKIILEEFDRIGIENSFMKEEIFEDAYTSEIWFYGPLYKGSNQTQNKFRIDAGERGGTLLEPKWKLIDSEYPETKKKFLVQVMDEDELLVEKIITMLTRSKGRDLYDIWYFFLNDKYPDPELFDKKLEALFDEKELKNEFSWNSYPTKEEYLRDMERLVPVVKPYSQVVEEVKRLIERLKSKSSKNFE
ncbi:MAG: nucleotidyl transferase AbiEii/AbiGii toxin family protein [Thermoplasmata archaeon]